MGNPTISIIMPVYNTEQYLPETIQSIQRQTFADFEVVCVDDGSHDNSVAILEETAKSDDRFILLHQKNAGAGAARNYGFTKARGEYCIFLDSDDLFSFDLLEKLYDSITHAQADIAACNFSKFWPDGRVTNHEGVHTRWIPNGLQVFNYLDCPNYIMRVINPTPWNKMYRSDFIREKGLKFEEISSTNDITFASVSVAAAERVTYIKDRLVQYRVGHGNTISSTKTGKLDNVTTAVFSAARQAAALPHGDLIRESILSFIIDNFIVSLTNYIKNFSDPKAEKFYRLVHDVFNHEAFDHVDPKTLHSPKQYREFKTVRKQDYDTMKELIGRKLIASFTTHPKRIDTAHLVVNSLLEQTRKADKILLWLAEEQFPGKETELPAELLELAERKAVEIRWCDDLKPHKKYFYTMQEYPDDLVVTVDDDLLYAKDMIECLYNSYLMYPDAVSTVRAHLIILDEDGEITPYRYWIQETDTCIYEPSMQLFATSGAGVLYPPHLLRKEFFDKEAILNTCLWADDLWLKAMQAASDVPVVVAKPFAPLQYLPASKEEPLHLMNVSQGRNDVQLSEISKWMDETFEPGILKRKINSSAYTSILDNRTVTDHINVERKLERNKRLTAERKLDETQQNLKASNQKLKASDQKLKQLERDFRYRTEVLKQTEERLAYLEYSKPIGTQLRLFGEAMAREKQERGNSFGLMLRKIVYYLAWIPEKILAVMMYYMAHGLKNTLKHCVKKLLRK